MSNVNLQSGSATASGISGNRLGGGGNRSSGSASRSAGGLKIVSEREFVNGNAWIPDVNVQLCQ